MIYASPISNTTEQELVNVTAANTRAFDEQTLEANNVPNDFATTNLSGLNSSNVIPEHPTGVKTQNSETTVPSDSAITSSSDLDLVNVILDNSTDYAERNSETIVPSDFQSFQNSLEDCNSVDCHLKPNATESSISVTTSASKILWSLMTNSKPSHQFLSDKSVDFGEQHSTESYSLSYHAEPVSPTSQISESHFAGNELDPDNRSGSIDYVLHLDENTTEYSSLGNEPNENHYSTLSALVNPLEVSFSHNMEVNGSIENLNENATLDFENSTYSLGFFNHDGNATDENISVKNESMNEHGVETGLSALNDSAESRTDFDPVDLSFSTFEVPTSLLDHQDESTPYDGVQGVEESQTETSSQVNLVSSDDSLHTGVTNMSRYFPTLGFESPMNDSETDVSFPDIGVHFTTLSPPVKTEIFQTVSSRTTEISVERTSENAMNSIDGEAAIYKTTPAEVLEMTFTTDHLEEVDYQSTHFTQYGSVTSVIGTSFESNKTSLSADTDEDYTIATTIRPTTAAQADNDIDSGANFSLFTDIPVKTIRISTEQSFSSSNKGSIHHSHFVETESKDTTVEYQLADTIPTSTKNDGAAAFSVQKNQSLTSSPAYWSLETSSLPASASEFPELKVISTQSDASTMVSSETRREGKHIPFSITWEQGTTIHPPSPEIISDPFSRYPQTTVTEENYGYAIYNRVRIEDLAPDEKVNTAKAFITFPPKAYSDEELNDKILIIHMWLLHAIADEYKNSSLQAPSSVNEESDEIEFDNLPQITYIEPTPQIDLPEVVLTFIVNNKWRNVTYPVDLVITILKLHSEDLKHLVEIEEIRFTQYYVSESHDLITILIEKYGIVLLSTCCITIALILFLICVVIYIRRKNRHSAHTLTSDKLHRNLREAMGIDLNPAVIILQDEIREKAALNGKKISSLDDDEGWLAPIDDVPLAEDKNAPFIQDTKL